MITYRPESQGRGRAGHWRLRKFGRECFLLHFTLPTICITVPFDIGARPAPSGEFQAYLPRSAVAFAVLGLVGWLAVLAVALWVRVAFLARGVLSSWVAALRLAALRLAARSVQSVLQGFVRLSLAFLTPRGASAALRGWFYWVQQVFLGRCRVRLLFDGIL